MATITTLLDTNDGAASLSTINTNFSNLNTDKLEATDITGKLNLDQTTAQTIGDTTNRLSKLWATDVDTNQISTVGYIGLPIDGGALTLIDLPQASAGAGTEQSYDFKIDGTSVLKVKAAADGSGGLTTSGVGIGVTPTASVHIKAGSATAGTAPIKLISGVLNTTPEIGAIEFDGTDFYLNI